MIDCSGCYLPGLACQKVIQEDIEVAQALVSPDHIVAADIWAAVVKTVTGYVPFFIGSAVVQINVIVSVPVICPDDVVPCDRGIGVVERSIGYGNIGQHFKVVHLNIRILWTFPVIRPDDAPIADSRFHLDVSRCQGRISACLDVVEIYIRAVVQIGNEFAINLRVRLLAGLGVGRGLLSCEVHVGNVGLSGAIIRPGYNIATDRRKRLIS